MDEEMRYKKKLPSDISKSAKKARHRHIYKDCILQAPPHSTLRSLGVKEQFTVSGYCVVCGKRGCEKPAGDISDRYANSEETRAVWRAPTVEKLRWLYGPLPVFHVSSVYFSKSVDLSELKEAYNRE